MPQAATRMGENDSECRKVSISLLNLPFLVFATVIALDSRLRCARIRNDFLLRFGFRVSTGKLGCLKDREIALMAERSEVHSLNEEVSALRSSIVRLLDEVSLLPTLYSYFLYVRMHMLYL